MQYAALEKLPTSSSAVRRSGLQVALLPPSSSSSDSAASSAAGAALPAATGAPLLPGCRLCRTVIQSHTMDRQPANLSFSGMTTDNISHRQGDMRSVGSSMSE